MKRVTVSLLAAGLCAAAPLAAQERRGERGPGSGLGSGPDGRGGASANPSAAIAAELALAKDSRERGLWPALAAAAAPEAIWFAPHPVWAQIWLKGRAGGPPGTSRDPFELWSSCDGSLVLSRGGWRGAGRMGRFTTLWQRQADGGYRWLLAESSTAADPGAAPEMIAARLADCPERAPRGAGVPPGSGERAKAKPKPVKTRDLLPSDPTGRAGSAIDGSLKWAIVTDTAGGRRLTVSWRREGRDDVILDEVSGQP